MGFRLSPPTRFQMAVKRRVIVHLHAGFSLDGILAGLYADGVTLDAASYVRADEHDTPLDGVQIIPWQSIAWVQELNVVGPSTPDS